MTLFSDQHGPPVAPVAAPDVPKDVRGALLDTFRAEGAPPDQVWKWLLGEHGFGSWEEAAEGIEQRFGPGTGNALHEALTTEREGMRGERAKTVQPQVRLARALLRAVPTPLFLDAVEGALEMILKARYRNASYSLPDELPDIPDVIAHVNRVFERRGVQFAVTDEMKVVWHGDQTAYEEVIAPARSALSHPALAGARDEFESAVRHLRAGAPKDREDAIDEAAKAVESGMKVLLDRHGQSRTGKETAEPLWKMLHDAGIVVAQTRDAVLAPSRLRNALAGHGSGAAPRNVPPEISALAVQSAAAALVYLGQLLPD